MSIETIKTLIEQTGGVEYLLGFRFANGYKVIYSRPGHFLNIEEDFVIVNGVELLKYEHHDSKRVGVISYLEVDEIAQVYILPDLEHNVNLRLIMD